MGYKGEIWVRFWIWWTPEGMGYQLWEFLLFIIVPLSAIHFLVLVFSLGFGNSTGAVRTARFSSAVLSARPSRALSRSPNLVILQPY